jgi:hypothetical protein
MTHGNGDPNHDRREHTHERAETGESI